MTSRMLQTVLIACFFMSIARPAATQTKPTAPRIPTSGLSTARIPRPLITGPRILIAFAGDSYASGEGAPNQSGPRWVEEGCHRSRENGRYAAANAISARLGEGSMAFIDVSCSGATARNGILGRYEGVMALRPSGPGNVRYNYAPQIDQIAEWMKQFPNRRLDALVLSVGGNDVGFAKVVSSCMTPGNCDRDAGLATLVRRGDPSHPEVVGLDGLEGALRSIDASVRQKLNPKSVILTGYPDPLRDRQGSFCNGYDEGYQLLAIPGVNDSPVWGAIAGASVKEISTVEARWLFESVLQPLNSERGRIAGLLGWQFAPVDALTNRNGFCAGSRRMFQTPKTSIQSQGDYNGTAHPDRKGFGVYREAIEAALVRELSIRQEVDAEPQAYDWFLRYKPFDAPPPTSTSPNPQIMRADPRPTIVNADNVDSLGAEPAARGEEFFLSLVGRVGPVPGRITEVALQYATTGNPTAQTADTSFTTKVLTGPRPGYHITALDSAQFPDCRTLFVRWRVKSAAWYDPAAIRVDRSSVKRLRLKCNGKSVEEL